MLICHRHRFIFIKTLKTAGTSVEGFLSDDLAALAATVALNLPRFKVIHHQAVQPSPPLENYLSAEAAVAINIHCSFSFDQFGYRRRQPETFSWLSN